MSEDPRTRLLEQALDRLDPANAPHSRKLLGVDLHVIPSHVKGADAFAEAVGAQHLAYLEARYDVVKQHVERRAEARRAETQGLDRFLEDGNFKLDDLLEPVRKQRRIAGSLPENEHGAQRRREQWAQT